MPSRFEDRYLGTVSDPATTSACGDFEIAGIIVMPDFILNWDGDALLRKMGVAAEGGVEKTIAKAAKHASDKAPVRSGDLRDSIEPKGVEREGDDVVGYPGVPTCPMRCRSNCCIRANGGFSGAARMPPTGNWPPRS